MQTRTLSILSVSVMMLSLSLGVKAEVEIKPSPRIDYAEQLLMHSDTAKRLEESESEDAIKALEESRSLYHQARSAQKRGDFDEAESFATDALRRFTSAARFLPRPKSVEVQLKEKYVDLTKEIFSYLEWYDTAPYVSKDEQEAVDRARSQMAQAKDLVSINKVTQANRLLTRVLQDVVELSNRSLKNSTVISSLDFESPEEELKYEVARNDDYKQLIPIAIEQKQPTSGRLMLLKRFEQKAINMRVLADQQRAKGELELAIKSLQDSTDQYIRALGIVGVR